MKVAEVFDSDRPGQSRICRHKIVFHVMLSVCSVMLYVQQYCCM